MDREAMVTVAVEFVNWKWRAATDALNAVEDKLEMFWIVRIVETYVQGIASSQLLRDWFQIGSRLVRNWNFMETNRLLEIATCLSAAVLRWMELLEQSLFRWDLESQFTVPSSVLKTTNETQ
jgi:hypothetical protein